MSQHEVERVVGRALTDIEFRTHPMNDAREACTDYDLTEEELDTLENLDLSTITGFSGSLD